MTSRPGTSHVEFPFAEPPENATWRQVAPGILWLRLALPFALNHVNLYLIEDDGGWALLDTGIADARTRAVWQALLAGGLGGRRLTRLIVTHYHPDHAGLAGWIADACGIPMAMSAADYAMSRRMRDDPAAIDAPEHRAFYRHHGLDAEAAAAVASRGHAYLRMTTDLPAEHTTLRAGDVLRIGGRSFEVLTGGGHAPEQVMLLCRAEGVFLPADQVLARISPNISVMAGAPQADPLGDYLASLSDLIDTVPADALVLPMHNMPFRGLHVRARELQAHHQARCAEVLEACAAAPRSAAQIVPALFPRALDVHQLGFAFGETLAHINRVEAEGALARETGPDGVARFRAL